MVYCHFVAGRKRRGSAPGHFCKSSGSVARKVLQSLEDLKLIVKDDAGYVDIFYIFTILLTKLMYIVIFNFGLVLV